MLFVLYVIIVHRTVFVQLEINQAIPVRGSTWSLLSCHVYSHVLFTLFTYLFILYLLAGFVDYRSYTTYIHHIILIDLIRALDGNKRTHTFKKNSKKLKKSENVFMSIPSLVCMYIFFYSLVHDLIPKR